MSLPQTKQDFTSIMQRLLSPLKPLFTAHCAGINVGGAGASYPENVIRMEAFSRPLWALAPFWAGGGVDDAFAALYQKGLAAGTDPQSPEYWGSPNDYDQRFVEMAAIACAIIEAPQTVWQPLDEKQKHNLAAWLATINAHQIPDCNWRFFRVLVNLALKAVDMPCDMALADEDMQQVDTWYVGDGWYSDGPAEIKPQKDYYIPWAIQYYGVLYSVFAADTDPARAAVYRERALAFGRQFACWFDENGAAMPFGRSLTYRFAQCAFYSACVWAGLEPLPLPVMKGIIARNLQWWLDKQMLDRDGVLTVGYCYPNLLMSERYNAPGSPYWGMKAFILLALPDGHPFWQAQAAPLPPQLAAPGVTAQPSADFLLHRQADGQLTLYSPAMVEQSEHGQFAEKYGKFAYSTRFGFSASRSYASLQQAAPDSMLAFIWGDQVFVRRHSLSYSLAQGSLTSVWQPLPGVTVTTVITPTPTGHTRAHTVENELGAPVTAYDCGFALNAFAEGFAAKADGDTATVSSADGSCTVQGTGGEGVVIDAWPNTSLYYKNTKIPAVKYEVQPGETKLVTIVTSEVR